MMGFAIVFSVCFIQATEYSAANLSPSPRLRALTMNSGTCANEGVLEPLPCKKRESILKREHLGIISFWAVNHATVILAVACADKLDWTMPNCSV